eukprot:g7939.t1
MSLRMGSNGGSSRANALDKRVPRNPRYANVKSKVETGMTVDKLTFVTTRQHLRRREEPYFRLTPSQLGELLSEYEQDQQEGVHDFRVHIDPDHHGPKVVEHEPDARPTYDRPYLILDVRPPEDYRGCHVVQARSFEAKLLNQDRMTAELHTYKNREGGLVVLYSNDDAEACQAARTLIHRGFDNVFVLSGGLVAFARGGYRCFVEGDVETLPPLAPAAASTGCTGGRGGSLRGGSGGAGGGGTSNGSFNGAGAREGSEHSNTTSAAGRLDYRYKGGQSVVVRGGGGFGNGSSTSRSSKNGSVGGMSTAAASSSRGGQQTTFSAQRGGGGVRGCPDGRAAAAAAAPCHAGKSGGGGGGGDHRPQNITGLRSYQGGGGLVEAAAAASAARRRSMQMQGEGGRADVSKGSAMTVADSVISRSTARRGRW